MELKAFDAASAYAKISGAAIGSAQGLGGAAQSIAGSSAGAESFGDMLGSMVGDLTKATRASETVAAQALNHKAGVVDVVTQVSNAEMVVNTVVAVRDKVIAAYQDIMKMAI